MEKDEEKRKGLIEKIVKVLSCQLVENVTAVSSPSPGQNRAKHLKIRIPARRGHFTPPSCSDCFLQHRLAVMPLCLQENACEC